MASGKDCMPSTRVFSVGLLIYSATSESAEHQNTEPRTEISASFPRRSTGRSST
jgi:hypothetical protein